MNAVATTALLVAAIRLGAPWIFDTDEPDALLRGLDVAVTNPAVPGNAWRPA
jgi:hypothetical protein